LAHCAAPLLPRFAARLAAALGDPARACWPDEVTLVAPGTPVTLADTIFFGGTPAEATPSVSLVRPASAAPSAEGEASPLLEWLTGVVRETLQLPDGEPVADRTLVALGMESLHAVALQYQLLEELGADVPMEELFAEQDVRTLAERLTAQGVTPPVAEGVPG
ncbi:MAG: acyl carrier protein, partial [Micromonosporaceae bacterium]